MKKILCILLALIMVSALVACGDQEPYPNDPGTNPAQSGQNDQNEQSDPVTDPKAGFPITYTPRWSTADVKSENNPDGTLSVGFGGVAYDRSADITLEYCKDEGRLFTAINGKSDWPASLDETWKSYGYTAIDTTDTYSKRTFTGETYASKETAIFRQYYEAMHNTLGFSIAKEASGFPEEEGTLYVPYCMITAPEGATIADIASAAHNALYIQAWSLIPLEKQGVIVIAGDKTYTVDDILSELGK